MFDVGVFANTTVIKRRCLRIAVQFVNLDKRVTPPKRVTSPTWGPPPPCKQAFSQCTFLGLVYMAVGDSR